MTNDIFDIVTYIENALKSKTLVPRALYNIKISYIELDSAILCLMDNKAHDMVTDKDLKDCSELLINSAHKGVCRSLLTYGLPLTATTGFRASFTAAVMLWVETVATDKYYNTLLNLSDDNALIKVENAVINVLEAITNDLKEIDPGLIDISDFFSYMSHDYISINDCVMYRSTHDEVISILRF